MALIDGKIREIHLQIGQFAWTKPLEGFSIFLKFLTLIVKCLETLALNWSSPKCTCSPLPRMHSSSEVTIETICSFFEFLVLKQFTGFQCWIWRVWLNSMINTINPNANPIRFTVLSTLYEKSESFSIHFLFIESHPGFRQICAWKVHFSTI